MCEFLATDGESDQDCSQELVSTQEAIDREGATSNVRALAQALTSGLADTLNQRYLRLLSHSQNSQPCAIAPALLCQLFCNSKSQFQSHYSISLSYLPEKSYNDTLPEAWPPSIFETGVGIG